MFFVLTFFLSATVYPQEGLRRGVKAPDFELPSVSGKKIALREFENKKVVIVHFWKSK
jgi:peroxiredoxin